MADQTKTSWPARLTAGLLATAVAAVPPAVAAADGDGEAAPTDNREPRPEQPARDAGDARDAGRAAKPVARGSRSFRSPIAGPVTSDFGSRWGRLHAGLDISASTGTPVHAIADGKVVHSETSGAYGNYLCVRSRLSRPLDGDRTWTSCYAHLSSFSARAGESVRQGELIGHSGCTGRCYGEHLHFEIRRGGSERSEPTDPARLLALSEEIRRDAKRRAKRRRAARRKRERFTDAAALLNPARDARTLVTG
jgi:murein DD-endopeptidase MepM/ murein hydrolase activator NlpD